MPVLNVTHFLKSPLYPFYVSFYSDIFIGGISDIKGAVLLFFQIKNSQRKDKLFKKKIAFWERTEETLMA